MSEEIEPNGLRKLQSKLNEILALPIEDDMAMAAMTVEMHAINLAAAEDSCDDALVATVKKDYYESVKTVMQLIYSILDAVLEAPEGVKDAVAIAITTMKMKIDKVMDAIDHNDYVLLEVVAEEYEQAQEAFRIAFLGK
jgi:hypothetical protein